MSEVNENEAQTVERLTGERAGLEMVTLVDGRQMIGIPSHMTMVTALPAAAPLHHIKRTVGHQTIGSFVEYLQYALLGHPALTVFVDLLGERLSAIVDFDSITDGRADWADHRVVLTPVATAEWVALRGSLNTWLDRDQFRELIYRLQGHIATPSPLGMLELAEQFNVSTSAEFSAGEKLSSGARTLRLVEKATATGGGAADIEVPSQVRFKLSMNIDTEPIDVSCKFRYRLRDSHLELRFDQFDLGVLAGDLFRGYAARVSEGLPTVRQVVGQEPTP
jgi:Uncharacterized conserved protein (DUF2303)